MESQKDGLRTSSPDARAKLFSWNTHGKRARILSRALGSEDKNTKLHNLMNDPKRVIELRKAYAGKLKFPCVQRDVTVLPYDAPELLEAFSETDPSTPRIVVDGTEDSAWKQNTPPVDFLDNQWTWPKLMLNMVETLGCSVERTGSDPVLPEEFVIDCFRRNLNIQTVKDCRILIFELLNNGILEEVRQEEYSFVYHIYHFCLNAARQEFEEDVDTPSLESLISHLIHLLTRVRKFHSIEFLSLVDFTTFFRSLRFADLLENRTPGALKSLVDLYCVLSNHIDITGAYLEFERNKFFYSFKDRQVNLKLLAKEILSRTSSSDKESMEALLWLRWTISGEPSADKEILGISRDVFVNEAVIEDKGVTMVPSFLKSIKAARKSTYDININPCLSI
jgi:hypothetical protein